MMYWIQLAVLFLFTLGTTGLVINRANLILTIMSIELMFLASAFLLLMGGTQQLSVEGQLLTLFILTVAAAESALGLAILIAYYRLKGTIVIHSFTLLKG